ncbi:hypothetical protein [Oceanimonas baumannii]|uniref:Uncharacterized protein n=1 Tax=Oceanimonas baumannii TaxID=129578 RepID=A0A235CB47_9GAMM|nr:hypothetical protein [Oceanimonas baumannii]OYD21015.1 hypothetical protein B6S09_17940 [Oceanimonas baumannii]TDW56410.1 hypothetical protein LY04_03036 [Oceanimonas baumannii]
MKVEDYNPKAREVFGKTLIDISVAIFKGLMLLVTIVPLGFIAKATVEKGDDPLSFIEFVGSMSRDTYFMFSGLLIISFVLGHCLRKEGLKHIHESENS